MRYAVLVGLLLLAGCGRYEWVRIAPGPGNFPQDDYLCQRDSVMVAPPAVVEEVHRDRRSTTVTARDVNQGNRRDVYHSCMASRGWREVFISDEQRAAPRPVAVPAPAPGPAVATPPPGYVAQPPTPVAFNPSGVWRMEEGDLRLTVAPDGSAQGQYPDGTIHGRLKGHTLEGIWREASSERRCRQTADGRYWGRFVFHFTPDGREFNGRWGYCDDQPREDWSGSR